IHMAIQIVPKSEQAYGAFNGGEIVENKPIGFNREGGKLKAYSNLFYWAFAEARVDSTIGLHPHQGFEIMSFVLNGEIRHYDTAGKKWISLVTGDVQIIRSGSGISHAEFMAEGAQMFQIWFDPGLQTSIQKSASYNDYKKEEFENETVNGTEETFLVGPKGKIQMDSAGVEISRMKLPAGSAVIPATESEVLSVYVLQGSIQVQGEEVVKDDFILIQNEKTMEVESEQGAELFLVRTPGSLPYSTYGELMQQQM
ncbi:MAG: hypothetical protein HKN16_09620, partial [Saprospiraceae bacterium]|nr:hypothetical protein [Saprospiraceae bacterium]